MCNEDPCPPGTVNSSVLLFNGMTELVCKDISKASKVFSSIAVFELMRLHLRHVLNLIPNCIRGESQTGEFWVKPLSTLFVAKVSLDRLEDFLTQVCTFFHQYGWIRLTTMVAKSALLDAYTILTDSLVDVGKCPDPNVLGCQDVEFFWSKENEQAFRLRVEGALIFEPGITLITGPTGAGKTSLLLALLGQLPSVRYCLMITFASLGEMHSSHAGPSPWFNLPRQYGVAYAAQGSWVQNETIKVRVAECAYLSSAKDHSRTTLSLDPHSARNVMIKACVSYVESHSDS